MASDRDVDNGGDMILGSGAGNAEAGRKGEQNKNKSNKNMIVNVRMLGCFFEVK